MAFLLVVEPKMVSRVPEKKGKLPFMGGMRYGRPMFVRPAFVSSYYPIEVGIG
jgi:hypothetical protein